MVSEENMKSEDFEVSKQSIAMKSIICCFSCNGTGSTQCLAVESGFIICPYCKKEE